MENYSAVHSLCVQVFEAVAKSTSIFVLPVFMMRIVFANLLAEGAKIFTFIKGLIVYFSLILAFPLIIEILFSIPETYLPQSQSLGIVTGQMPESFAISTIPIMVDRVLEVILAGLYWLSYYVHIFFMIMMCSMAPIVFLSSTLLGFGLGIEVFMGLLLAGSSWPLIWYGFDQVHTSLSSIQMDEFGAKCLELLITVMKGISPVAFASLAIKSPPGRLIAGLATQASQSSKWIYQRATQSSHSKTESSSNQKSQTLHTERTHKKSQRPLRPRLIKDRDRKGEVKNENPRPRDI